MAKKYKKMSSFDWLLVSLVLVGGLNWGLIGFFNFNLVSFLFGSGLLSDIIYGAVGVSALIGSIKLFKK